MPTFPGTACSSPGCPDTVAPNGRGRCSLHREGTTARGYGISHQRDAALHRPGARCEACGCTRNLQRDHRTPASLGGTDAPDNKRWLCACTEHRCHSRFGVRRDTIQGGSIADGLLTPPLLTPALVRTVCQSRRQKARTR